MCILWGKARKWILGVSLQARKGIGVVGWSWDSDLIC